MKKPKAGVTIDDLAIIVAKGFFAIDQRFDRLENDLQNFKDETRANFERVEENFRKIRNDILNIHDRYATKRELDDHVQRFHLSPRKAD